MTDEGESQQASQHGWWLASDGSWYPPEARALSGQTTSTRRDSNHQPKLLVGFAYVAIGLGFVASFMPWASVFVFTVDGTRGDGKITLVLALVAGAFLLGWHLGSTKQTVWLVFGLLSALGMASVYWYDLVNVSSRVAHANSDSSAIPIHAEVGSGLYVGAFAATAAVILLALLAKSAGSSKSLA